MPRRSDADAIRFTNQAGPNIVATASASITHISAGCTSTVQNGSIPSSINPTTTPASSPAQSSRFREARSSRSSSSKSATLSGPRQV